MPIGKSTLEKRWHRLRRKTPIPPAMLLVGASLAVIAVAVLAGWSLAAMVVRFYH